MSHSQSFTQSSLPRAETAAPERDVSGRIGSPAPPVENYKPTRSLLARDAPRSADGVSDAGRSEGAGSYSVLNIKRYRRYFNVDTGVRAATLHVLVSTP